MTTIPHQISPSRAVAILAASLLVGQSVRAQPAADPDELIAFASNRPTPAAVAKPNGSRFTSSAAQFAEVKREVHVPRAMPKRIDGAPYADPGIPEWVRLSTPAEAEAALKAIPEIGLPKARDTKELLSIFSKVAERHWKLGDDWLSGFLHDFPEFEGLPFRSEYGGRRDFRAASLEWTSEKVRTLLEADLERDDVAVAKTKTLPGSLDGLFRNYRWSTIADHMKRKLDDFDIPAGDTAAAGVLPGVMQILATQPPKYRLDLVRQIRNFAPREEAAIDALVRLAVFDSDADVRIAAIQSLEREPQDRVGAKLLSAIRYPWPIAAERAAEAIVELDRTDLLPKLVEILGESDPNAVIGITKEGSRMVVVRETVKLNHHRNCIVCHRPAETSSSFPTLTVPMPSPDVALPRETTRSYYGSTFTNVAIQGNEVLLRQDFSRLQKVADSAPWIEMQRFDYVVRTRQLPPLEAMTYLSTPRKFGEAPPPHRRAAIYALTRLTGTYVGTEAFQWRPAIAAWLEAEKNARR